MSSILSDFYANNEDIVVIIYNMDIFVHKPNDDNLISNKNVKIICGSPLLRPYFSVGLDNLVLY